MNQVVADSPYVAVEDFESDDAEGVVTIDNETGLEIPEVMPDDTEENRAVLDRVEQRKINLANEWWNLAADLYEVQTKKLYKLLGFAKLDDYYDAKINATPRYGYDLTDIHKCFAVALPNSLADRPDDYDEVIRKVKLIGVTKTKEIAKAKINDPEIIVDLVNQTFELNEHGIMKTVTEVKTMINNYKHAVKDEPSSVDFDEKEKVRKERTELNKKEVFKFKLPMGQAEKVKESLALALKRSDLEDNDKTKSLAFFRICEEWAIESRAAVDGDLPSEKEELKRVSEIYNLDAAVPFYKSEKNLSYESSFQQIEKLIVSKVLLLDPLTKGLGFEHEFKLIEEVFGIKIIAFKADDKGFIDLKMDDGVPTADCIFGEATFNDLINVPEDQAVE